MHHKHMMVIIAIAGVGLTFPSLKTAPVIAIDGDGGTAILTTQVDYDDGIFLASLVPIEKMAVRREGVGEVIRPGGGSGSLMKTTFKDKILDQINAGNYPLPPPQKFGQWRLGTEASA